MRIVDKLDARLNEQFREKLKAAMLDKFQLDVNTWFDILGTFRLITERADGEPFTPEQKEYLEVYERGYNDAWSIIKQAR